MSLYHEAAEILTNAKKNGGSLKSQVFGKKTWKSDPKALFALAAETAKWSDVLSEIVEKSGVLKVEKTLTPTLALLLIHDLFLSKKGIALPATHGLNTAASRHKVRLSAELTKARLRRGFGSLDELRNHIDSQAANGQQTSADGGKPTRHPRWIRINTLKTTIDEELDHGTFANWDRVKELSEIIHAPSGSRYVYIDEHIPNLVAVASPEEPTSFKSYKNGKLILQEKASCFPAYLLDPTPSDSKVIDACAAPGNKTTHLAAILGEGSNQVVACEKDAERSKTLSKMVKLAGAESIVNVKQKQDFTRSDPNSSELSDVTDLLLDPSCSGSGIYGRDEATLVVHLPSTTADEPKTKGKKRKRGGNKPDPQQAVSEQATAVIEETPDEEAGDEAKLQTRLQNLSGFQLRIVQHAMSFPAAKRITYSTCSVHAQENENVVVQALLSDIAAERGWRMLIREDQVDGMKRWRKRGSVGAVKSAMSETAANESVKKHIDAAEVADACIRCDKGGEDGTMGFFVAGFVRDHPSLAMAAANGSSNGKAGGDARAIGEDDEWGGFSDDDT